MVFDKTKTLFKIQNKLEFCLSSCNKFSNTVNSCLKKSVIRAVPALKNFLKTNELPFKTDRSPSKFSYDNL